VPRTGVFLDRDDTIIRDVPYLSDPEQIELLPEVPEAIRFLNENTIPVIIITNQSGITRGLLDEGSLCAIHERLVVLLAAKGASIDAIYYCPHHPEGVVAPYRRTYECR
jgi:HAD superfamily hydrolase (TIGR01662 family)